MKAQWLGATGVGLAVVSVFLPNGSMPQEIVAGEEDAFGRQSADTGSRSGHPDAGADEVPALLFSRVSSSRLLHAWRVVDSDTVTTRPQLTHDTVRTTVQFDPIQLYPGGKVLGRIIAVVAVVINATGLGLFGLLFAKYLAGR